jgi:flagellar hook assembly protein FlgD
MLLSVSFTISVNGISSEYTINPQDLESAQVPAQNALLGNYPNPFNPVTNIRLSVAESATQVSVKIFNIKGQLVKDLFSGELDSGYHSLTWNGDDNAGNPAASGLYFYQAQIGAHSEMSKMLMLK